MRKAKGFKPLEDPRLAGTQIIIPNPQSGRFLTGFTLIELLVVISVIVLLMAILLPTLQRVRKQAGTFVCQANLRQWGTTLALYVEDNQGRFPRTSFTTSFLSASLFGADLGNEREPRLKGDDIKGILCCPMAVRPRDKRKGPNDYRIYDYTFTAWERPYKGVSFRGSYGFNRWLLIGRFDESSPYTIRREGIDVFSLRGRGSIPTLLDCTELDVFGLNPLEGTARAGGTTFWLGCLLHKPSQRARQRPFLRLVGKKNRAQGTLDLEMDSRFRHGRPLDQGRRRPARRLAPMDEKV